MTIHDENTGFDKLPENPDDVPASVYSRHEFNYPDYDSKGPSRFAKYIRISGITSLLIIAAIAAFYFISGDDDDAIDDTSLSLATPSPDTTVTVAKPTATAYPTPTPLPTTTPVPVLPNGITPLLPTAEASAPEHENNGDQTPTPAPPFVFTPYQLSLIFAFASCNGLYEGDALAARDTAARDTIASRSDSTEQILNIAIGNCQYTPETLPTPGPAAPMPVTPLPPTAVPTLPTPSPPQNTLLMELRHARWLSHNQPAFFSQLEHIPWILGPMDPATARAAQQLVYIAIDDPDLLSTVVSMPFLRQPDDLDHQALRSLRILSQQGPDRINAVLRHPTVTPGITEAWTPVVAVLHQTGHPAQYLDISQVSVETKHTLTPHHTEVTLSIVRSDAGASITMDTLEQALYNVETYMTVPLPTSSIIVFVDDDLPADVPAVNLGTHIGLSSRYDDPADQDGASQAPFILAHEVAHYYWHDNRTWLDEGVANIIAYAAEEARTGNTVRAVGPPCAEASSISQLESLAAHHKPITRQCVYSISERLFLDLQQEHQQSQFRAQLQQLYTLTAAPDTTLGIEQVRQVMGGNPQASALINHWYLGEPLTPTGHPPTRIDISAPNPAIPQINGYVQDAYLSLSYQGKPIIQFSATQHQDYAYVNVHYLYNISGDPQGADLEIVEYFQDGFATRSTPHTIVAEPHHSGGTFWIPVGPGDNTPWRTGSYWTMVYHQGYKIAQVQWNVTP